MDFTLVNSPPGGRSVPIQDAAVVGFSKLERTQVESRSMAGFRARNEFIFLVRRTDLM